jgi:hypothetical protein
VFLRFFLVYVVGWLPFFLLVLLLHFLLRSVQAKFSKIFCMLFYIFSSYEEEAQSFPSFWSLFPLCLTEFFAAWLGLAAPLVKDLSVLFFRAAS